MSESKYYGGRALKIAIGITMMVLLFAGSTNAATLTVCKSGCAYSSIQTAINASSNGDTIQVQSGTYNENVNVNKQLTLRGIGRPVVNTNYSGSAITLAADRITLEGFTAEFVMYEEYVIYIGIRVNSNNNTLINNNANTNTYSMRVSYGIYLDSSNNNTLIGNNAFGPQTYGIYLDSSNNNMLIDNNASNNYDREVGTGVSLISSNNNTLIGNNASNNVGEIGIGIHLISSNNNTLISNNADSNFGGYGSSYGIILSSSSNNTLISNNANSNIGSPQYSYGIYLGSSSNNTLTSNNASNNDFGISLESSSNNKIFHNDLIQNLNQANDNSNNNSWDNGYPSGGNYWSDYTGVDLKSGPSQNVQGSDGIGDMPYPIAGGSSVDRYPLMAPYTGQPPTPSASALTGGLISINSNDPTIVTLDSRINFYFKSSPNLNFEMIVITPDSIEHILTSTTDIEGIAELPLNFNSFGQPGNYIAYLNKVDGNIITSPKYYIKVVPQILEIEAYFDTEGRLKASVGERVGFKLKTPYVKANFGAGVSAYIQGIASESNGIEMYYEGSNNFNTQEILSSETSMSLDREAKIGAGAETNVGANIYLLGVEVGGEAGASVYTYSKFLNNRKYYFGNLDDQQNWKDFRKQSKMIIWNPDGLFTLLPYLYGTDKYKIEEGFGAGVEAGAELRGKFGARKSYDAIGKEMSVEGSGEMGISHTHNIKDDSYNNCVNTRVTLSAMSGDVYNIHTRYGLGRPTNNPIFSVSKSNNIGKEKYLESCTELDNNRNPIKYSLLINEGSSIGETFSGEGTDLGLGGAINTKKSYNEETEFSSNDISNINPGPIKETFSFYKGDTKTDTDAEVLTKDLFDNLDNQNIIYTKRQIASNSNSFDIDVDAQLGIGLGIGGSIGTRGQIKQEVEKGYFDKNTRERFAIFQRDITLLDSGSISNKFVDTVIKESINSDWNELKDAINIMAKDIIDLSKKLTDYTQNELNKLKLTLNSKWLFLEQKFGWNDLHIHVIDQYGRQIYYDYKNDTYINEIPSAMLIRNITLDNGEIKDLIIVPNDIKFNAYVDSGEAHNITEPYNLTILTFYNNDTVTSTVEDEITKGSVKQYYFNFTETNNNLTINMGNPSPYICGNNVIDPGENMSNCAIDLDVQPPVINSVNIQTIGETILLKVDAIDNAGNPLVYVNVNTSTGDIDIPLEYNKTSGLFELEIIPIQSDTFNMKIKVYDNINKPPVIRILDSIIVRRDVRVNESLLPYNISYYQDGIEKSEIETFRPFDIIFELTNGKIIFNNVVAKRLDPHNLPGIYSLLNVTLDDHSQSNKFIDLDALSLNEYLGENASYNAKIELNKDSLSNEVIRCKYISFNRCMSEQILSEEDYSILNGSISINLSIFSPYGILPTNLSDTISPVSINNISAIIGTTWLNFTWLNPADPDFSHVMLYLNGSFKTNITAPQNYYNFTGLQPDTVYELGTHTVDSSGNVNETWVNTTGRTTSLSDFLSFTISLKSGWNLISVPLNLTAWELGNEASVGKPINVTPANCISSLYQYNTTSTLFEKSDHFPDWGWWPATGSESFTALEPGRGYWAMAQQDCSLTFTGTAPTDLDIPLNTGWNLIGWYSLNEVPLGEEAVVGNPLNATPANSLTSIYLYNTTSALFEKSDHFPDWGWWPATGSESFTTLQPGRGYWVMAQNDSLWRHNGIT